MTAKQWFGAYHATVFNNADPAAQNRVQLKVPQVLGTAVSHWARPLALVQSPPAPGTKVIAMFAGGDISHPLYIMETDTTEALNLPVSVANGGTGATTAAAARAALGAPQIYLQTTVPTGANAGDIWIDNFFGDSAVGIQQYNGTSWTVLSWGLGAAGFLPLPIANGGTGQTTAAAALAALGGLPLTGGTLSGALTISSGGLNVTGNTVLDGTLNIPANSGAHFGVDNLGNIYMFNSSLAGAELGIDPSGNLRVLALNTGTGVITAPGMMLNGGKAGNVFSVGGGPSDFEGTVYLEDTTKPATPASSSALYSNTGKLHYVGEDGNDYTTGRLVAKTTATQTINVTSFTNVTNMSVPVGIGTYIVDIWLRYVENAAAGVPRFQITGPATSLVNSIFSAQAAAVSGNTDQSASNGGNAFSASFAGPTMTSAATTQVHIWTLVTTTAAGTIQLQADTSVTTDTFTIQPGSSMVLYPV